MIEFFTGILGGGKSYSAVHRIIERIAAGGMVYTNVAVYPEKLLAYVEQKHFVKCDPNSLVLLGDKQISDFQKHTAPGSLLVIDESHEWFNARDWDKASRTLLSFLTQSRKYDNDIIFITQHDHNLDKQFSRLVANIWKFKDLSKEKLPEIHLCLHLPLILQVCCGRDGRTVLSTSCIRKKKEIFALYNTLALYNFDHERIPRKVLLKPKLNHRKAMKVYIFLFMFVTAIGYGVKRYFFYTNTNSTVHATNSGLKSGVVQTNVVFVTNYVTAVAGVPVSPRPLQVKPFVRNWRDIYFYERVKARIGPLVVTDVEQYQVGNQCSKGRVESITETNINIVRVDGLHLLVTFFEGANPPDHPPQDQGVTTIDPRNIVGVPRPRLNTTAPLVLGTNTSFPVSPSPTVWPAPPN